MAYNVKDIVSNRPSRLTSGHRMCAGCGAPAIARMVLRAVKPEDHAVVSCATGCMEVSTFIYPYTAWKDSFVHTAFENAAATLSGAEAAYKAMKNAKKVILEVSNEFEKMTGRKYGFFEEYKLDDAEIAIVCMNSTAGTTKFVVDELRAKGVKAGLLKLRVYRPFPAEEIA